MLGKFISVSCEENVWTAMGLELGADCGRKAVIVIVIIGTLFTGRNLLVDHLSNT